MAIKVFQKEADLEGRIMVYFTQMKVPQVLNQKQ